MIYLVDTANDLLRELRGHSENVLCVTFNPSNPKQLVSGSCDHTIRVWDLTTETTLTTLIGHFHSVMCVAFNPDNPKQLLSGSSDRTVRVWDLPSGS